MTQWVENARDGRARGPRGLASAWIAVLVRPRTFFRENVAPGDQAPGLVFAVLVAFVAAATRFALVPAARPTFGGNRAVATLLAVVALAFLVAPAVLHFAAALETLSLLALLDERGGVSETVQVVAYASAPCLFAGVPSAALQIACAGYGAILLAVGTREVHDASPEAAAAAAALPGALVFGYAFGGFDALTALFGSV